VRIEDYALIGDLHTAALVGRDGSIDWLCLPRFDSGACFAALLGEEKHGCWRIAPAGEARTTSRRYRDGTLVLETDFETDEGAVRVVDCMLVRKGSPVVVRLVEGLKGTVPMRMELVVRPDYGSTVPWVDQAVDGLTFLAGPNALYLRTPVETRGEDFTTVGEFSVREDERVPFTLAWGSSHEPAPAAIDPLWAVQPTATEHVAEASNRHHQHGDGQQVGVHHPLQADRRGVEILLDGRKGERNDRRVQHQQE
jgi:GH15 family glucan-1,4-alpha-glucosidase